MRDEAATLSGRLAVIRYHKNNFLIGQLDGNRTVKGSMLAPQVGLTYWFSGKWENHSQWGRQFAFEEYRVDYPTEPKAVANYLEENCDFIGPITAQRITDAYGADALGICKNNPERVAADISGITLPRALNIAAELLRVEKTESLHIELKKVIGGVKLSRRVINAIIEVYGADAPAIIRENPYQLIPKIHGIGFTLADAIAQNIGFAPDAPARIRAGIIHTLVTEGSLNGHVCVPFDYLVAMAVQLLGVRDDWVSAQIIELINAEQIIEEEGFLYDPFAYADEKDIIEGINALLDSPVAEVTRFSADGLQSDQIAALEMVLRSKIFILTGAPGTGKTFTIKRIIDSFKGEKIALAAPTGKAARRMYEQTGFQSQTIHRLLEPQRPRKCPQCKGMVVRRDPITNARDEIWQCQQCKEIYDSPEELICDREAFKFTRNELHPLDEDLIILDECSMIDNWLMASLIRALRPETRLILVGDTYQLPSVGPGNILKDLIASGRIQTAELTVIKRQDPGDIITNCHRIKNGENIHVSGLDSRDFFFLPFESQEEIQQTILDLVSARLPKAYDADPMQGIQVITPLRTNTELSCRALNEVLRRRLNGQAEIPDDTYDFWLGDKVIQTRNDYEHEIVNGDIGFVRGIDTAEKTIVVEFQERTVCLKMYENDLMLAYALTCHKFQGSEADIVVIPIHRSFGPLIMQRPWLYTAISRAKKICVLVGQRGEVPRIIERNNPQKRWTRLAEKLKS